MYRSLKVIWLILLQPEDRPDAFYLEIPLATTHRLRLSPRKYLIYLGWWILGFDVGVEELGLAFEGEDGNVDEIDSDGDVDGGVIYYFVATGEPGKYSSVSDAERTGTSISSDIAVVDVIKSRTAVPSETTATRNRFREDLLRRDKCCVYTGIEAEFGDGLHLIPFKRGSEVRSTILTI